MSWALAIAAKIARGSADNGWEAWIAALEAMQGEVSRRGWDFLMQLREQAPQCRITRWS